MTTGHRFWEHWAETRSVTTARSSRLSRILATISKTSQIKCQEGRDFYSLSQVKEVYFCFSNCVNIWRYVGIKAVCFLVDHLSDLLTNMRAIRVLLIFQLLACLMAVISGCNQGSCHPFIGLNKCNGNGYKEPKLPPRDNACCGAHCVYNGPSCQNPGPCDSKPVNRCILDSHCGKGVAFYFVCKSDCELIKENEARQAAGYAREYLYNFMSSFAYLYNLFFHVVRSSFIFVGQAEMRGHELQMRHQLLLS